VTGHGRSRQKETTENHEKFGVKKIYDSAQKMFANKKSASVIIVKIEITSAFRIFPFGVFIKTVLYAR